MRLSRLLHKVIPLPQFTTSRLSRRERAVFYYSNMFCIAITALPVVYLLKANYWTSEEQENLYVVLSHNEGRITNPKQLQM
ncbi:hypothetical protein BgAZ_108620 [Babesia gibsoni]|uniref:Uncharacterized protein n=1 Tax=Babesia gibsoni TaxID=33632 RepID=A0AAD8UU01_BABGI|nr:hypothetical protein BgAZ_108620 [Babesia gibsoni]